MKKRHISTARALVVLLLLCPLLLTGCGSEEASAIQVVVGNTYTSQNWDTITSDEYYDSLIKMGAYFIWYFHYMPVGNDAAPELLPNPEQRKAVYERVRRLRAEKPMFAIDFQK